MSTRLPMFPLGLVMVPHVAVPLHIFETRYRVLMFDCTHGDAQAEFGVVLIERGSEVGGNDQRFGVGTVARIAEAAELPDGRWLLNVVGTRRIRVAEWLPDDPYPSALVDELPDLPWTADAERASQEAERQVRRALAMSAELGDPAAPATIELDGDPKVAGWQLLAIAPIGPFDQQRLLEIDDHRARLSSLAAVAEESANMLAHRLAYE
jgi:Lon protease-like protein